VHGWLLPPLCRGKSDFHLKTKAANVTNGNTFINYANIVIGAATKATNALKNGVWKDCGPSAPASNDR